MQTGAPNFENFHTEITDAETAVRALIVEDNVAAAVEFLEKNPLLSNEFCVQVIEKIPDNEQRKYIVAAQFAKVIEAFMDKAATAGTTAEMDKIQHKKG